MVCDSEVSPHTSKSCPRLPADRCRVRVAVRQPYLQLPSALLIITEPTSMFSARATIFATMTSVIGSPTSHLSISASQTFRKAARIASMCAGSMRCFEKGIWQPFCHQTSGREIARRSPLSSPVKKPVAPSNRAQELVQKLKCPRFALIRTRQRCA
jgi:hypothetical protein